MFLARQSQKRREKKVEEKKRDEELEELEFNMLFTDLFHAGLPIKSKGNTDNPKKSIL
jgi:hypothetical protein